MISASNFLNFLKYVGKLFAAFLSFHFTFLGHPALSACELFLIKKNKKTCTITIIFLISYENEIKSRYNRKTNLNNICYENEIKIVS